MKYIEYINKIVREEVLKAEKIVLFGQNISAGSCISGLTKNFKVKEGGFIINTPNSENSLCGLGFGLMISGVSSIFFMKQQDFLLLGIDQIVNTYNFIRRKKPTASFTIMPVIVDSGYEGPQSCLNNFGDFCSIARIPGFTVTNKADAEYILKSHLVSPGFRIIGISQRLFKEDLIEVEKIYVNEEGSLFQYKEGGDLTIVCFNFSLPYGLELYAKAKKRGVNTSLFSVNAATPLNWSVIIDNLKKTKNLVVINDTKSANISSDNFLVDVLEKCPITNKIVIKRDLLGYWLLPCPDKLDINYDELLDKLLPDSF